MSGQLRKMLTLPEWGFYWYDFGTDIVLIGYFEDTIIKTLFLHSVFYLRIQF